MAMLFSYFRIFQKMKVVKDNLRASMRTTIIHTTTNSSKKSQMSTTRRRYGHDRQEEIRLAVSMVLYPTLLLLGFLIYVV